MSEYDDLKIALEELSNNQGFYAEAHEYYEATVEEVYANNFLKNKLSATSSKFRIPYARTVVTAVLNRLEITGLVSPDAAQQEALDDMWNDNQLNLEAPAIHEEALVSGETYIIVEPDEVDANGQALSVNIRHNDATSVRVIYSSEDKRTPICAIKKWVRSDDYHRVTIYYPWETYEFISTNPVLDDGFTINAQYVPYLEDENDVWPKTNDFGVIPVFHMRTEGLHGRPEHFSAYGAQNALNKLHNIQLAGADYMALPQRYALAEAGNENQNLSPAQRDKLESTGVASDNTSSKTENLQAGPGTVWYLQGMKDVGEFTPADPSLLIASINAYVIAMSQATDTPLHMFKQDGSLSGYSRRMAEAPLVKKVETRQRSFGATWASVFEYALLLLGFSEETIDVIVNWDAPDASDPTELMDIVKSKTDVGIPLYFALLESGYTPDALREMGIAKPTPLPEVIDSASVALIQPPVTTSDDVPPVVSE